MRNCLKIQGKLWQKNRQFNKNWNKTSYLLESRRINLLLLEKQSLHNSNNIIKVKKLNNLREIKKKFIKN